MKQTESTFHWWQKGVVYLVYLRRAGDERRLMALNFVNEERRISIAGGGKGRVAISTHLDREEEVDLADLRLRPHEGVVVAL